MTYQQAKPYLKKGIKMKAIAILKRKHKKSSFRRLPVTGTSYSEETIEQTDLRRIPKIFKQGDWHFVNSNMKKDKQ